MFDYFGLAVLVINTITVGLAGAIFPPGPPGGVGLAGALFPPSPPPHLTSPHRTAPHRTAPSNNNSTHTHTRTRAHTHAQIETLAACVSAS